MPVQLQREIENLKKEMLTMGAMAELSVREAALGIQCRDEARARSVIEKDVLIDEMEVEIEETCLKIMALHRPVVIDLRFIIAVLKISSNLERVGDLAVNIAEDAMFLATHPEVDVELDFSSMAVKTQELLRMSLEALVNMNASLARKVCSCDDEIDAIHAQMYMTVQEAINTCPHQVEPLMHLLSASRHLERIADHATNIAEDVIYMIEGEIVRHKAKEYRPNQVSHLFRRQ